MLNQNLLLAGDDSYNLSKSLRFRSSASAYLNRTPASAGNQKTWTYSTWVKRGKLGGTSQQLLTARYPTASWFIFGFRSDDTIEVAVTAGTANGSITNAVFRDPSAWYHLVLAFDSTQATASNRVKLYVNNVLQTFSSTNYPALNTDYQVNQNISHTIGGYSGEFYDGYIAETIMVDGQALTPSSFGSTNGVTGVWQPAKYTGTYGTNGFYLPFTDVATTSGSNAGLGKDFSGNGNYWNTNNISVTAGATYDSMTDVPTLTSATASNYAVLNSAIRPYPSTEPITDGNLKLSCTNAGVSGSAWATIPVTSGKWYWEATVSTVGTSVQVGVSNNDTYAGLGTYTGAFSDKGYAYRADGAKILNGVSQGAYGASYTTNDVIGVALDADAGSITFYKNGTSQGVAFSGTSYTGGYFLGFMGINGSVLNANFGQRPFSYTPPTGFVALNTFNLPTPTIGATASTLASKNFDATTYTGNGSTLAVTNSGSFQPDFVWTKSRSNALNHNLFNIIQGTGKGLVSNSTAAEFSDADALQAFNSNGFSVGPSAHVNTSGYTYVAWQWKANGSAVTNTAGSITSQVSANASAGFSVVTYTGNASVASFGHGLGVAPKMIIIKNRSASGTGSNWCVGLNIPGWNWATDYLYLNTVGAKATDGGTTQFYSAPTSSVVNIGGGTNTNGSGNSMVAYCFSEVAGYSKFGSYTGNGSTDGPFVHLGFKPKFLIIKSISAASNWNMFDSSRDTYNMNVNSLVADAPDADANWVNFGNDFLSNGFKMRTNWANLNTSGNTYIYMAFAEVPSKYANAR